VCAVLVTSRSQAGTWVQVCETHWFAIHCPQTHRSLIPCHAKGQLRLPQPPLASTRRRRVSLGTWTMPSKIAEKGTLEHFVHLFGAVDRATRAARAKLVTHPRRGLSLHSARAPCGLLSRKSAGAAASGFIALKGRHRWVGKRGRRAPSAIYRREARTQRMPRGGDSQLRDSSSKAPSASALARGQPDIELGKPLEMSEISQVL